MSCTTSCVQPSPAQAHCGACHRTFGGVSGFDRHRRGGLCLSPAEIGYADNGRGVFREPLTDSRRKRLADLRGADGDAPLARSIAPQSAELPTPAGVASKRGVDASEKRGDALNGGTGADLRRNGANDVTG